MKIITTAAVAALLTTTAVQAGELGATGITWGIDTVAEYAMDAEAMTITATPELGYDLGMMGFTVATDLPVYSDEFVFLDVNPILDFKLSRELGNVELYGRTSWDLEDEDRGDIVVGAKFSF